MPPVMDQPPVGDPMMEPQQMDGDMPPVDDGNDGMGDVNGEENEDNGPGSDIRKYSGELSQALNDYNQEFSDDKQKLNKYAINMIAAQVKDKLDDKDRRNVMKKLGIGSEDKPHGEEAISESYNDDDVISEIMDELINGRKPMKRGNKKLRPDISRRNPFVSSR